MRLTSTQLLLTIGQVLTANSAHAEPELSLSWSAPALACPDRGWAMRRIGEQLGRAPAAHSERGVDAIVTIETRPRGFALVLRTTLAESNAERLIEGEDCSQLAEAATLIIALGLSEASEPRARAPVAATDPKAAEPPNEDAARARTPESTRLGYFVRADLALSLGLVDTVMLGPSLALALERAHWRVEVAGVWFLPSTLEAGGEQIEVALGAASAGGCALFGAGRVRGGACAFAELGRVSADSDTGVPNHTWWAAAMIGGRLGVTLWSRLSAVIEADLLASLARPRFQAEDDAMARSTLHTSAPLQLRSHAGLELRF